MKYLLLRLLMSLQYNSQENITLSRAKFIFNSKLGQVKNPSLKVDTSTHSTHVIYFIVNLDICRKSTPKIILISPQQEPSHWLFLS